MNSFGNFYLENFEPYFISAAILESKRENFSGFRMTFRYWVL